MQDDFLIADRRSRRIDFGAWMWVKCAVFFIGELAALFAASGYSVRHYDLSYLGIARCTSFFNPDLDAALEMCSPLFMAYNIGLILFGLFVVFGVLLTWPLWPRNRLATLGLGLYALSGIGGIVTGAFPVDSGLWLHTAGATTTFVAGGLAILLIGLSVRTEHASLSVYSLITAALVLGAALLYALGLYLGLGRGGMERLAAYPLVLWPIAMGAAILTGWFRPLRSEELAYG
ncbi:hypothetical protein GCM10007989_19620 [Devosia pacifica]|uniref:DUF998 domain-containing protein n=1 Tax=Devosia pacifica TaxID=1335967 RepID=A0A918S6L4_9HYPH|nr:DUF998 domain-containing protein [Devosia pacifica]GHA24046.1 hypothetical protein GCM10007989_19620 [Devosia pacifica]